MSRNLSKKSSQISNNFCKVKEIFPLGREEMERKKF